MQILAHVQRKVFVEYTLLRKEIVFHKFIWTNLMIKNRYD